MNNETERQFHEAEEAIERTVASFIGEINQLSGQWKAVAPAYVVQGVLLALCENVSNLIDDPKLADALLGPATLRLSNALADYRDSPPHER